MMNYDSSVFYAMTPDVLFPRQNLTMPQYFYTAPQYISWPIPVYRKEFKLCEYFYTTPISILQQHLNHPLNLNQRCDCCWDAPLHLAVRLNSVELLNTLVIRGARFDRINKRGETALHVACELNNDDMADRLLDLRVNPHRTNHKAETCMAICMRTGHIEVAETILRRTNINLRVADPDDYLMMAVRFGSTDFVELFIKFKANIDYVDRQGNTAVSLAVELGKHDVLHCLLWHGADITRTYARDNETLLHMACRLNREVCAKKLLLAGASVSSVNNKGETPLHVAAKHSSLRIIQMLLDEGSSMEVENSINLTPLHFAITCNKTETVKYLLSRGASAKSVIPLLVLAVKSEHYYMVKLLVSHGIDLDQDNSQAQTLVDAAMKHGNADIANFFKSHC